MKISSKSQSKNTNYKKQQRNIYDIVSHIEKTSEDRNILLMKKYKLKNYILFLIYINNINYILTNLRIQELFLLS